MVSIKRPVFSLTLLNKWTGLLQVFKASVYGSTDCWVFKGGIRICKDLCLKINLPKGNDVILRIGVMGRRHKVTKFDFQSQFSIFIEKYQFSSTFFVPDIFW